MDEFLLFDVEANGFKPDTIWMVVVTCLLTRKRDTYVGLDEVAVAIDRLSKARMVSGHYIKGYDLKVFKNLCGVEIAHDRAVDTLELSKRLCALDRHGLDFWGSLVGLPKLKQPRFDIMTEEMIPYCERDVDLNVKVFDVLVDLLVERELLGEYPLVADYVASRIEVLMESA